MLVFVIAKSGNPRCTQPYLCKCSKCCKCCKCCQIQRQLQKQKQSHLQLQRHLQKQIHFHLQRQLPIQHRPRRRMCAIGLVWRLRRRREKKKYFFRGRRDGRDGRRDTWVPPYNVERHPSVGVDAHIDPKHGTQNRRDIRRPSPTAIDRECTIPPVGADAPVRPRTAQSVPHFRRTHRRKQRKNRADKLSARSFPLILHNAVASARHRGPCPPRPAAPASAEAFPPFPWRHSRRPGRRDGGVRSYGARPHR